MNKYKKQKVLESFMKTIRLPEGDSALNISEKPERTEVSNMNITPFTVWEVSDKDGNVLAEVFNSELRDQINASKDLLEVAELILEDIRNQGPSRLPSDLHEKLCLAVNKANGN